MRLIAFAALGGFCALHWSALLVSPPGGRIAVALATVCAGAAALQRIGSSDAGLRLRWCLAALASVAILACALVAIGVPAHLLAPGAWDQLGARIGDGVRGLGQAEYPFEGTREWSRLVLLAGLAAILALAAVLTFWPRREGGGGARPLGLATLLGGYAAAVAISGRQASMLAGVALLGLVAAWLWLPRLAPRQTVVAVATVAAAGLVAVPAAAALDRDEPWVPYEDWTWDSLEKTVAFDWDHRYGPLDWPRDGTTLLEIESEKPHYWRATVLDNFDGTRWGRSGEEPAPRELPGEVEGTGAAPAPEWSPRATVTVRALRSADLVSPGAVRSLDGIDGEPSGDGTTVAADLPQPGDSYSVTGYEPDPSADELRRAPPTYDPSLRRYTELQLAARQLYSQDPTDSAADSLALLTPLRFPLREGRRARLGPGARRVIADSGYGRVYALVRSLTDGRRTPYAAVRAVERRLQRGYLYSEDPPVRARPLPAFLFRDRAGYCQQFSGAMALMLRMAGIPSRVATGFSPGTPTAEGGFQVSDLDAHSWVEVYFTGIGWVPFDPTPGVAPAISQAGRGDFAATPSGAVSDRPRGEGANPGTAPRAGTPPGDGGFPWWALGGALCLLAVAAAARMVVRALRFRSLPAPEALAAQIGELRAALPRVGQRVPPGATLRAMERRLSRGSKPRTAAYLASLRAGRYAVEAGPGPTLAQRRAMRRELRRRWSLRGRALALLALPPGGPRAAGRGSAAG